MITLNNGMEIPQIGVGTWTLKDESDRSSPPAEPGREHRI